MNNVLYLKFKKECKKSNTKCIWKV